MTTFTLPGQEHRPSEISVSPRLSTRRFAKIDEVAEDEWGYMLYEHNRLRDDLEQTHRFQVIQVVRETKLGQQYLAECSYDLGDSMLYTDDGFSIPGGAQLDSGRIVIEHKVGELITMAFEHRGYMIDPDRLILDGPSLVEQFLEGRTRKVA